MNSDHMIKRMTNSYLTFNSSNKKASNRILSFVLLSFLSFIFTASPLSAGQNEAVPSQSRPRIGLVLSGGGARGIAHIGVIKVLEEMNIPVDFIAGTSMGAIVGGLYAAGASPADLEKLVTSIDWDNAFTDRPAVDELAFRRKEDSQRYKIDFDLGYRDGKFAMPKGFIQGQNLNILLKSLLLHTFDIKNFDNLHIPFRAIAADIETGNPVLLSSGDLAHAIRASMSIPGVFAPVEIGGRLLVDGGIANNLPVDVARQMGADILIVVDISTHLRTREKLSSAAGITAQVMTILIEKNVKVQLSSLKKDDILIQPDLGDIGTTDFSNAVNAIKIGYDAAIKVKNQIAQYSVSPEFYKTYLARQRKIVKEPPIIDYVKVERNTMLSAKVLEAQVETKAGDKLDEQKLVKDVQNLYGLNVFESVDFRLEKINKQTGLVLEPVDKSWGNTYIKFSLSTADNFKGENTYSFGTSITKTGLNALGGEWRTELQIGDAPRVFMEFYQPVSYSTRYFVNPQIELRQRTVSVFDSESNIVAQYLIRYMVGGIGVGRQFGNWGELRVGIWRAYGTLNVNIGDPTLGSDSFNRGGLITSFSYNTMDKFDFPSRGAKIDAVMENNMQALGSDNSANNITLGLQLVKTWGKYTFMPGISYSGFFNSDAAIQDSFSIGGFFNLSGYLPNELSGQHIGIARVIFYRNMGSVGLGNLRQQLYLGASLEAGNAWPRREDITFDSLIYAGSVFVGLNTFLGPVYLGYGMAEGGHKAIGLYIGQRF